MDKNEAVAILSYADTEDKLGILRECIKVSKDNGYKVILSSGYEVPEDVQNDVDYLIFDSENPVITGEDMNKIGGYIFFTMSHNEFENSHCVDFNHSYAVLKLMKNAATVANNNNITKIHYINYDYIIYDPKLLERQCESLESNDLFHYYDPSNENYMNTCIFSIRTDKMISCFQNVTNKEEFCREGSPVLEEYMLKRFNESNLKIEKDLTENIKEKNKIDLVATCTFLVAKKIDGEDKNLFLYLSEEKNTGKYYIIVRCDVQDKMYIKTKENKTIELIISDRPRVIEVEKEMINDGIEIFVERFNHNEIFDNNKKLSSCNIKDYGIVEHINDFNPKLDIIEPKKQIDNYANFYDISLKNGTDKVHPHGYHFFYPKYFNDFRFEYFKMLEIGYGSGSSLKTWIEYFPNADITILDIEFNNVYSERCRVIKGDQSKFSDLERITKLIGKAKLIIDDGSHNPLHQFDTFNHLFKNLLEPGGIYIIEDIEVSYWDPDSKLYGYKSGYFNIIDAFKTYQEMINSEFSRIKNYLDISTITFAQNCIIITKRTEEEILYFDREYRFIEPIRQPIYIEEPEKNINLLDGEINVYDETLHDISKRIGTDKSEHLFTIVYETKFSPIRNKNIKFLEIGLWLGSSIRMWVEYFKNGEIYGADILNEEEMKAHVDNINRTQNLDLNVNWGNDFKFLKVNQDIESDLLNLDSNFDVIIDDGGHTMLQQQLSLKILIEKINSGGYYVIEDVHTSKLAKNPGASFSVYGANEKNNTLDLLVDLKNKKMRSNEYYINESEFNRIIDLIDEIDIVKTKIDSITCIIKKI